MALSKALGKSILILAFWLGVWEALALLVGKELLLPDPLSVLSRLAALAASGGFWRTAAVSLGRILLGGVCGIILGTLLAAVTCRFSPVRALLSPLLTIARSTPVASFILLVLIWVGRDILPCVIVIVMVAPVVWANVSAGVAGTDPQLLALARVYRFGSWKTLRLVYIPSVTPYFIAACQTALGLSWKAGVAAEVLAVPTLSIGRRLYEAKLYLETADLFAWTVVVVLCSLALEKLLNAALGRLGRRYPGGDGHA